MNGFSALCFGVSAGCLSFCVGYTLLQLATKNFGKGWLVYCMDCKYHGFNKECHNCMSDKFMERTYLTCGCKYGKEGEL